MSAATVWPRAEVSLSQEGRVRINIGGVTSTPETENLEGARAVERAGGTWESERPGGLDERADAWAERARRVAASRPR